MNYLNHDAAADSAVTSIERAGGKAIAVAGDVATQADVVRLFETVDQTLGTIDVLVNNAGILDLQTRLEHVDAARPNRILATNVTGSVLGAREAGRRMSTKHGGYRRCDCPRLMGGAPRLGSPGEYVEHAASKGAIDTMSIACPSKSQPRAFA